MTVAKFFWIKSPVFLTKKQLTLTLRPMKDMLLFIVTE